MRTIVAGSRTISDYYLVAWVIKQATDRGLVVSEVVSGKAPGVDILGEEWADAHHIPKVQFPADDESLRHLPRRRRPLERNTQMAQYAQALVAIHDGTSTGTLGMLRKAKKAGLWWLYYNNATGEIDCSQDNHPDPMGTETALFADWPGVHDPGVSDSGDHPGQ